MVYLNQDKTPQTITPSRGGESPAEGEIKMKELEKIMKMLTEAGYAKNCKMSNQPDRNGKHGLYINCRNSQYVTVNDDGTIQMQAVGGSRYSYPHIKTAEDCAKVMIEQCGKTTGEINEEYRALRDEIKYRWGGAREGSGRPSTGRKKKSFYITEEEYEALRKYLEELRQ